VRLVFGHQAEHDSQWAALNSIAGKLGCTVWRLLGVPGLQDTVRGKACKTTIPDAATHLVQRQFHTDRPNQLWVADFTYVATWAGVVCVAFVIHVFARRIVGGWVASSMRTDLVLNALEQALWSRSETEGLVHHSDRGVQYLSIRYPERIAEAGVESSVGSRGDSYDNALAETIIGLSKTEVIRGANRGEYLMPSRTPRWNGSTGSITAGGWSRSATSSRRSWNRRIIGNGKSQPWRPDSNKRVSGEPGAVHS